MQLTLTLHRHRRLTPDRIATIDGDTRRTWTEMVDRIARRAAGMRQLGVQPGDRVALISPNSADLFEAIFAALWAGAVFVPINLRWSAHEVGDALKDCTPSLLLVADGCRDLVSKVPGSLGAGAVPLHRVGDAGPLADCRTGGDQLATILYTGGTTGRPKGVMLSHGNLMASALGYAGVEACAPGETMLHTAPMFHIGALSAIFASMLRGSRHAFLAGFDAAEVVRLIAAERVTDTFLVPTMLHMLLEHPSRAHHDLSSIERILYGASPITSALMARAQAAFPQVGFVQAYGMTELSPVVSLLSPDDHTADAQVDGRIRSAGRPIMTVDTRIVDGDGDDVGPGEIGEVIVRGPTVMQGYWNQPDLTRQTVRDGWMYTGDMGWLSLTGYLHIADRIKDMIISGGENVYSAEVERVLASHPDVAQCAIIGIPDEKWGEIVHAAIIVVEGGKPHASQLAEHCIASLASFKCPRSFSFHKAFPLSPVGKVSKVDLRRLVADRPDRM